MKAALFEAPHRLAVREVDVPSPGPGEVLVRVASCGLCGTDQHIYEGDFGATYPLIPGHEISGTVEALGEGAAGLPVGERAGGLIPGESVAVNPNIACHRCYYCQRNQSNHCLNWQAIGVTRPGGFAPYVVAPFGNIYPVGDLPLEQAALVEPISCVVYALDRVKIPAGSDVLIFGAGPMGQLMSQLVRHGNAARVVVSDLQEGRLAVAAELGAHQTVVGGPDGVKRLRELAPHGFDVVIDVTGVPAVVEGLFEHVRPCGKVLFFGVCPTDARISISPFQVYRKDLEIYGSFALRYTFHQAIALLRSGAVTVDRLISHRLPIDGFAEGLRLQRQRDSLKVLITP